MNEVATDYPRTHPDRTFIDAVRARFPVESEIDRILTRKMSNRAEPGYTPIPLNDLVNHVRTLISANIGDGFTVADPRWLQGGASKIQMAFTLDWNSESGDRIQTPMVLRMEPPESIVETSRNREFEMLQIMRGTVPVPPCYWNDPEGEYLPYPGLIYGFAEGNTKPKARAVRHVTGVGTNYGPELRPALADQFINNLAAIHTVPEEKIETLRYFDLAEKGSNSAILRQINWWRRVWEEDRPEDIPLVDVAAQWLIDNAPVLDHVSIVHGDYRAGNFLFSETSQKITAWLDWELAVLGDRHQDLSWFTGEHLGHYSEDGNTFLACGLLPAEELYERYERASGLTIYPERLEYFRVMNSFMSTVHMLATAWRVANSGKTHQDVLVAWVANIGNVIIGKLRDTLEEIM